MHHCGARVAALYGGLRKFPRRKRQRRMIFPSVSSAVGRDGDQQRSFINVIHRSA